MNPCFFFFNSYFETHPTALGNSCPILARLMNLKFSKSSLYLDAVLYRQTYSVSALFTSYLNEVGFLQLVTVVLGNPCFCKVHSHFGRVLMQISFLHLVMGIPIGIFFSFDGAPLGDRQISAPFGREF